MAYEIGKKYEGLHDGRWYICTIFSQKGGRYKVTFDGWSRQFDTVLSADCLRSCTLIDVRSRKRWRPSVNFNKLLPGDEVFISIEGIRKSAAVRVVDPFLELVTVECGNEEIIASFRDVLPPPEPTPDTVKRQTFRVLKWVKRLFHFPHRAFLLSLRSPTLRTILVCYIKNWRSFIG